MGLRYFATINVSPSPRVLDDCGLRPRGRTGRSDPALPRKAAGGAARWIPLKSSDRVLAMGDRNFSFV